MTFKIILIQLSQHAFNISQLNYDCSMFVNTSIAKQLAIYEGFTVQVLKVCRTPGLLQPTKDVKLGQYV